MVEAAASVSTAVGPCAQERCANFFSWTSSSSSSADTSAAAKFPSQEYPADGDQTHLSFSPPTTVTTLEYHWLTTIFKFLCSSGPDNQYFSTTGQLLDVTDAGGHHFGATGPTDLCHLHWILQATRAPQELGNITNLFLSLPLLGEGEYGRGISPFPILPTYFSLSACLCCATTAPSMARLDGAKIDLMQGQLAQKHFEQHLPSAGCAQCATDFPCHTSSKQQELYGDY